MPSQKHRRINVYLPEDMLLSLKWIAIRTGTNVSALISRILDRELGSAHVSSQTKTSHEDNQP